LQLSELGAEVSTVRRGKARIDVQDSTILQGGDIVVVRGPAEAVSRAETRLLKG
jgi:CPA2 family monovalent cation:H+ antiporter-2